MFFSGFGKEWNVTQPRKNCPFDLISVFWNSPEKHEHNFISHIIKSKLPKLKRPPQSWVLLSVSPISNKRLVIPSGGSLSFSEAGFRGEIDTFRKLIENPGGGEQRSNCFAQCSVTSLELCGCSCPPDMLIITRLYYWTKFSSWEARVFFSSVSQYKKQYPNINTGRVERLSKLNVFNHSLWILSYWRGTEALEEIEGSWGNRVLKSFSSSTRAVIAICFIWIGLHMKFHFVEINIFLLKKIDN